MNWLGDRSKVGPDLTGFRKFLWLGQLGAALLLVLSLVTTGVLAKALVIGAAALMVLQFAISRMLAKRSQSRIAFQEGLFREAEEARRQIEQLFAMTDMLQSAENHEDAGAILEATARMLLPDFRGALYIFNNSQDRLDLARHWPHGDDCNPSEALVPGNCWALKRGKEHINDPRAGTLCCAHNNGVFSTIEVPMVARGKVHGLLMVAINSDQGTLRLQEIARVARALADSVSLALANIALQEKLRTQSLRDPLTGLYNRRYMEDALERYVSFGDSSGSPTSVLMIDLDHFKSLNDVHGHAKGDAVLRDVAAQLVGALRPSDVVSRYGGEELLVILPGCTMEDAMLRAEVLRSRVESLGEVHGATVTASFGVASVPETSASAADVVQMADAALYEAKNTGRNRVAAARQHGHPPGTARPRLAVG